MATSSPSFWSKFWPTLAAIGMSAVAIVTPQVQGAISSHPVVSTVLSMAYAILAHFLPSPVATPAA